jgi:hypothetical protein
MKKIEVQDHWKIELQKLRCWISGFNAGRKTPGVTNLDNYIPGEDVLRQIIIAIDDVKETKK